MTIITNIITITIMFIILLRHMYKNYIAANRDGREMRARLLLIPER